MRALGNLCICLTFSPALTSDSFFVALARNLSYATRCEDRGFVVILIQVLICVEERGDYWVLLSGFFLRLFKLVLVRDFSLACFHQSKVGNACVTFPFPSLLSSFNSSFLKRLWWVVNILNANFLLVCGSFPGERSCDFPLFRLLLID